MPGDNIVPYSEELPALSVGCYTQEPVRLWLSFFSVLLCGSCCIKQENVFRDMRLISVACNENCVGIKGREQNEKKSVGACLRAGVCGRETHLDNHVSTSSG